MLGALNSPRPLPLIFNNRNIVSLLDTLMIKVKRSLPVYANQLKNYRLCVVAIDPKSLPSIVHFNKVF